MNIAIKIKKYQPRLQILVNKNDIINKSNAASNNPVTWIEQSAKNKHLKYIAKTKTSTKLTKLILKNILARTLKIIDVE